ARSPSSPLFPYTTLFRSNFEIIVFGIALVLVLKYAPQGLWPFASKWVPAPQRRRDWADAPALAERARPAAGEPLLEVDAVRKQRSEEHTSELQSRENLVC